MTKKQIDVIIHAVLKDLRKKGAVFIARDKNRSIWAYWDKPSPLEWCGAWSHDDFVAQLYSSHFQSIILPKFDRLPISESDAEKILPSVKWGDKEPALIEDILKELENKSDAK